MKGKPIAINLTRIKESQLFCEFRETIIVVSGNLFQGKFTHLKVILWPSVTSLNESPRNKLHEIT